MRGMCENVSDETLKGKGQYRETVDSLRSRVNMLSGKDKILMKMYLENGNTFRQMARLAGVNEASIARRIRRIARQLIKGQYIECLRHRDRFSGTELDVAKDYYLMGLSMRSIAARRRWSYYRVRKTLKKIQRLLQESQ